MENKTVFGILCILLNQFGVPAFVQGDTMTGILRLAISLLVPCGIAAIANFVFGIIMGIEVLQMSDEDYAAKKGTFNKGISAKIDM